MKLSLTSLLVVATVAFATAASAHVVMVTTSIPAAQASNEADLEHALALVVDDAVTHTVAFTPTKVSVQGVRQVGDQIYLMILVVDRDGEQLIRQLEVGDTDASRSPARRPMAIERR